MSSPTVPRVSDTTVPSRCAGVVGASPPVTVAPNPASLLLLLLLLSLLYHRGIAPVGDGGRQQWLGVELKHADISPIPLILLFAALARALVVWALRGARLRRFAALLAVNRAVRAMACRRNEAFGIRSLHHYFHSGWVRHLHLGALDACVCHCRHRC